MPRESNASAERPVLRMPPRYSMEHLLVRRAAHEKHEKMRTVAEKAVATIPGSCMSANSTIPPIEAPLHAANARKKGSFWRAVGRDDK